MTILDKIISYKRTEVATAKANTPESALRTILEGVGPTRGFKKTLQRKAAGGFALIAEVKKASPSKGVIRDDFHPVALAQAFEAGGAACLSVLTDEPSFQGKPEYLRQIRAATALPILRKDFMIDPYQVTQARAWGADCILLIMACLSDALAKELSDAARALALDILVEVHDADEMARAANLGADMIGINNRNLKTFATDLNTTAALAGLAPAGALVISESGIRIHSDLQTLRDHGASAFLVGETLMRQPDVRAATENLLRGPLSV